MDDRLTEAAPHNPQKHSEIFDECFPFYLSIGMSSAEYWDGDPSLPRYFRKAFEMRQKRDNEQAWLNGLYVYDAMMSALSCLNPNKNSHKTYAAKPYSSTAQEAEKERKDKVVEAQAQAEVWMKSWAAATQKMFDKN